MSRKMPKAGGEFDWLLKQPIESRSLIGTSISTGFHHSVIFTETKSVTNVHNEMVSYIYHFDIVQRGDLLYIDRIYAIVRRVERNGQTRYRGECYECAEDNKELIESEGAFLCAACKALE